MNKAARGNSLPERIPSSSSIVFLPGDFVFHASRCRATVVQRRAQPSHTQMRPGMRLSITGVAGGLPLKEGLKLQRFHADQEKCLGMGTNDVYMIARLASQGFKHARHTEGFILRRHYDS